MTPPMFSEAKIAIAMNSPRKRFATFLHTPSAASQITRLIQDATTREVGVNDRYPASAIIGRLLSVIAAVERADLQRKGNVSDDTRKCATINSSSAIVSSATGNLAHNFTRAAARNSAAS